MLGPAKPLTKCSPMWDTSQISVVNCYLTTFLWPLISLWLPKDSVLQNQLTRELEQNKIKSWICISLKDFIFHITESKE